MGIHGLFAQIGAGQRLSLAKLSSDHYTRHDRPLRLAIDISIWLFQIQSGKGGSNPALRTFYYRLLRLLSLNIWPLFVFDGPNKPLFKRNKKVGGPGVRVASVPEFLAKQLLKQFGFPWHVAPGEAEAECALLQREGMVDAVLSEDVDTLMFGSTVTFRNWTAENSTKTPTHVNVYRAELTEERSGLRPDGMVLVALMSGGDYLPEGIPGCGPKVACDAARAGFGRELCALSRRDAAGIQAWKDRLQHEIRTNESKYFARRNTTLTIPEDFPNFEVLGYYVSPSVSTPEKLARLKRELIWDQPIDFAALRTFTADAFDWRCLGGAKKFIKNLAPAMLVRQLRMRGDSVEQDDLDTQKEQENTFVTAIHGKRNHSVTDGELEYRISFIPTNLVRIDLSSEEEDDESVPAGDGANISDPESEFMPLPCSTQESETATSPTKKRNFKPFEPDQPEKLWILKSFLQVGCPLLVEDYEASFKDPKEFLKARKKAKASNPCKLRPSKEKCGQDLQANTLLGYATVTKPSNEFRKKTAIQDLTSSQTNSRSTSHQEGTKTTKEDQNAEKIQSKFQLPATQISPGLTKKPSKSAAQLNAVLGVAENAPQITQPSIKPSHAFVTLASQRSPSTRIQGTPKHNRKRPSPDPSSPAISQKTITSFYSPSPRKARANSQVIDLISSSPAPQPIESRPLTPTRRNPRYEFVRDVGEAQVESAATALLETMTKRRRKVPFKRYQTAPVLSARASDDDDDNDLSPIALTFDDRLQPNSNTDVQPDQKTDAADTTPKANRNSDYLSTDASFPVQRWLGPTGTTNANLSLDSANKSTNESTAFRKRQNNEIKVNATLNNGQDQRKSPAQTSTWTSTQPPRRSPRQQTTKKRIELRESLEGWWKEVDAESIDLSGDGSGWKKSGGKAQIVATSSFAKMWRKSGVEVLDLSGT